MNISLDLQKHKCAKVELLKLVSFKSFQMIKEVRILLQLLFPREIYV